MSSSVVVDTVQQLVIGCNNDNNGKHLLGMEAACKEFKGALKGVRPGTTTVSALLVGFKHPISGILAIESLTNILEWYIPLRASSFPAALGHPNR